MLKDLLFAKSKYPVNHSPEFRYLNCQRVYIGSTMRWAAAASSSKNDFPALEWAMWVVRIQQPISIKKAQRSAPFLL
jgi:hypothetical protein